MSLIEISQALDDTLVGNALRESVYAFPIIEGAHLIGLALSVGLILFVDLRLVGLFLNNVPVREVLRPLRKWLLGGFTLTLTTGVVLFFSEASKLFFLGVFWFKIFLIILAGLNAIWFEYKWGKKSDQWEGLSVLPREVRFAGWTSIVLWTGVVGCGRLIPYLGTGL
ncbi:DUF6644 family protein [Undibacterium sp. SXout7W]|uniref:DUF6644 family protein n=1 Tax=Undibacterium sp. SXout7W TaxID=3413049 RepID=UPI003BF14CD3